MQDTPTPSSSVRRIRRFDLLQVGKVSAIVYGGLALLIAPFMIIAALLGNHQSGGPSGIFGVGFAFVFPVFYAIAGFLGGIIGAFIYNYNLAAKMVGGSQLEGEIE